MSKTHVDPHSAPDCPECGFNWYVVGNSTSHYDGKAYKCHKCGEKFGHEPAPPCAHTDCVRDEDLRQRRVKGTAYVELYCPRHDPLEDPEIADRFEVVG